MRASRTQPPATVTKAEHAARTRDGSYTQTAYFSIVRASGKEYRYLDHTRVVRPPR